MKNRTWVEIDQKALRHNFRTLREDLPKTVRFMAVVKSNAYGHGIIECAKLYEKWKADFLGVDSLEEALELRDEGIKMPILVLGYTPDENLEMAASKNISVTISSLDQLGKTKRLEKKLNFHLKIDTGLHRQGVMPKDFRKALKIISESEVLNFEGLYSHLAGAEGSEFDSYTEKQIKAFERVCEQANKAGFRPIKHISGTAAALSFPGARFGMVRVGIGLYGLWPSIETEETNSSIELKPALSWKTLVADVKEVKKGSGVGYDLIQKVRQDSRLAVIPVGYWHGYDRLLSGRAEVIVNGKRARITGRISMDMMTVNVTNFGRIKRGSEVVLIGSQKDEEVSAEELAFISQTINYETVTRINPEIPRIYK